MDENSVSFQMFLILFLLLHLVQKAKFLCSSNVKAILRCLFGGGACAEAKICRVIFSVKNNLHKALCSVQFLASFISFYFEILSILHVVKK